MKLAPMPSILCMPALPLESNGDSIGSTAMTFISGFFSFKYFPVPLNVPPVPTPAINISIFPSISLHISGPVVK